MNKIPFPTTPSMLVTILEPPEHSHIMGEMMWKRGYVF